MSSCNKKQIIDPVCGTAVDPAKNSRRFTYRGKEYSFCCPLCKEAFQAHPECYLRQKRRDRYLERSVSERV